MTKPSMSWADETNSTVRVYPPLVEIEQIVPWPTEDESSWLQTLIADALEAGETIAPYESGPAPNLTRISKADLWRRLTDEEAELLDAALQAAPVRLRRVFEAAQYMDVNDPDYAALRSGIVEALGAVRAEEVLRPTY